MDSILMLSLFTLEGLLLWLTFVRFGFSPLPTLAMFYLIVAQISLTLVYHGMAEYTFLNTYTRGGTQQYYFRTMFVYFLAFIFMFACFARNIIYGGDGRFGSIKFDIEKIKKIIPKTNVFFAIFILAYIPAFVYIIDWSVAWYNNRYLMMTSPQFVVLVPRLSILLSLFPFVGVLAGVLSAVNACVDRRVAAVGFFIVMVAVSLYYVSAHQRVAILGPVAFFTVLSVLSPRPRPVLQITAAAYAVFALASALAGRGSGSHGISTLLSIDEYLTLSSLSYNLILNMTEGIFVLAEGFTVPADYPNIYKILSFSPLPSAIDGFNDILGIYQVRLSRFAPFSGITEAYYFGPLYVVMIVAMFFISITIYKKVLLRNRYIGLACGLLILLSFVMIFAYPLRNSLKGLWMADFIGIGALIFLRRPQPRLLEIQGLAALDKLKMDQLPRMGGRARTMRLNWPRTLR